MWELRLKIKGFPPHLLLFPFSFLSTHFPFMGHNHFACFPLIIIRTAVVPMQAPCLLRTYKQRVENCLEIQPISLGERYVCVVSFFFFFLFPKRNRDGLVRTVTAHIILIHRSKDI
ncbi:hypothetical protein I7I50_09173 [Histoplasma capsulatum G186AR]|uniref:Uncharacterized protein n=1 Tax=Ajellomyces capsulatus TaxID=5037 RepID=A0A8H7YPJ6_AJECA|nr:hypothetical protein I7I52_06694 [Histoplasma capsulatum]QSS74121.1 hypothetical protein I7I50_09173 [Histoplasma capsulatum G186AR]